MNLTILTIICSMLLMCSTYQISNAEQMQKLEIEILYTNGDRTDQYGKNIVVYQDFEKTPFLEKQLQSNPETLMLPSGHKYKVEVYANDMYGDVEYVQLDNTPKKVEITIPISGGIQFNVFYKDGQTPIEDATVIIKSHKNTEQVRTQTNDKGETLRYWIQSTTKQNDHYVADVYLGEIFLKSFYPVTIQPGHAIDQKIITNIPKIVENLIKISLYEEIDSKIGSTDGKYKVTLTHKNGDTISSDVNIRGDALFSSLRSGTYTVKITPEDEFEAKLWLQKNIHITGDINQFKIFKSKDPVLLNQYNAEKKLKNCNCVAFRLDDIQDNWLSDTQIQLINLFEEKSIPLTIGIIGNKIGTDQNLIDEIKESQSKQLLEIANHSWDNNIVTSFDYEEQKKVILDTNQKIYQIFNIIPTTFIPPENLYDENTVSILQENNFTHISSHVKENNEIGISNGTFYKIPAITQTAKLESEKTIWKITDRKEILTNIDEGISKNGFSIIMMHPQEFSLNEKEEYDKPNQKFISDLSLLLDEIKKSDYKIMALGQIPLNQEIHNSISKIENELEIDNQTEDKKSCNCVAFRLDDVQDYWLNDVQISIINTFLENNTPVTIGIMANVFGDDPKIVNFVKDKSTSQKKLIEIASKGLDQTPFTSYGKEEQNEKLIQSLDKIQLTLNIRPKVFIPPENKFNEDTLLILKDNKITHISSSLTNGDSPPFEFDGEELYRFPQITTTGVYNPDKNIFEGISHQQTIHESVDGINNYGFSVITLRPQEFSIIENNVYKNSVNQSQIQNLKTLITELKERGYKIVKISQINLEALDVPIWIKNNAGWWADGSIDDKTFVQGIEYLVQKNIIKISEKSQTNSNKQDVPIWIKNNAGWWADGSIDDKTFVQGIEYLVKNGIITY